MGWWLGVWGLGLGFGLRFGVLGLVVGVLGWWLGSWMKAMMKQVRNGMSKAHSHPPTRSKRIKMHIQPNTQRLFRYARLANGSYVLSMLQITCIRSLIDNSGTSIHFKTQVGQDSDCNFPMRERKSTCTKYRKGGAVAMWRLCNQPKHLRKTMDHRAPSILTNGVSLFCSI